MFINIIYVMKESFNNFTKKNVHGKTHFFLNEVSKLKLP